MNSSISAVLVAAEAKDYKPWVDSSGSQRPGGVTYRLWLAESFSKAPFDARCSEEQYRQALGLGAGAKLNVELEVQARDNRLTFRVDSFAQAGADQVASLNGRKSA